MKSFFSLLIVLTISLSSVAQDSKLNLDLYFPVPIDNNFIGENYNGIIGLGVDYYILDIDPVNIGVSVNGGLLSDKNQSGPGSRNVFTLQPKIVAELNLTPSGKIKPFLGLGYSFLFFKATGLDYNNYNAPIEIKQTESGFNINGGFSFYITDHLFAKAQYDYVYLRPGGSLDIKYNTRINIFKIGLGYSF